MDTVMPLTLNLNKNSASNQNNADKFESHSSDSQSPSKKVLGRDQAKKRLQAFAQQWNKTKDNINHDKAVQVRPTPEGNLKYTYIVERENGSEANFPIQIIKYTVTQPPLSYCQNPHYSEGAFKSRKEALSELDDDGKQIMCTIMNSNTPTCPPPDIGFVGRYRKWYMDRNTFLGKPKEAEPECHSPHWDSDSEDGFGVYQQPFELDFMPQLQAVKTTRASRVMTKVKINKVELPFFEDDDFLESLVRKSGIKEESSGRNSYLKDNEDDEWARNGSRDRHQPDHPSSSRDWSFEDDKETSYNGDRKRNREASTPDWDEQWRSSSRYSSRRSDRHRRRSPRPPSPPEEEFNEAGPSNGFMESGILDDMELTAEGQDSKRISLDERLELELGIKVEGETSERPPSLSNDHSGDVSPVKRRPGFGPKAAPLGAFILNCRKALPAAPIIPPHLQKALCRPLSQAIKVKPSSEQVDKDGEKSIDKDVENAVSSDQETKKNWTKELNTLEMIANNLEIADDSVWLDLEEKLLRFEANMHSSADSPPPEGDETETHPAPKKKVRLSKRVKRPKPPPIEFKEAGKGILVMPRVTLLEDPSENRRKGVMFADNVKPGCGTSSEEEEEIALPVPPVLVAEPENKKGKKTKRVKKPKIAGDDFDPVFDMMPPPPPPPGSPPPHLPQGRSATPVSPSPPLSLIISSTSAIPVLINSPAVESGAC